MRRPKLQLKAENYRINSFVLILLTIFLTNLVLTFIYYNEFESISINRVYSYAESNLSQIQQQLEQLEKSVKPVAMQVFYDQYIQQFIFTTPLTNQELNLGLNQLGLLRYVSTGVSSIYVYNHYRRTFYIGADKATYLIQSEDEFFDRDIVRLLYEYSYNKPFIPIARQIPIDSSSARKETYYGFTFLLYDTFEGQWSNSAVTVNVSEEMLLPFIRKTDSPLNSTSLIIDSDGRQMISTGKQPMLTDLSGESYVQAVMAAGDGKGWFISPVDEVRSLVAYSAPDQHGWRYISVVPYSEVVKQIAQLRNLSIIISIGILALAIMLAFFLSRTLSAPVKRLLTNIRNLESDKRMNLQVNKNIAMRNLILDYGKSSLQALKRLLGKDGEFLESAGSIRLFLLKIDQYHDFCEQYNTDDRSLMKFAILNIASEMLSDDCQIETADMGDDKTCLLLFDVSENHQDAGSLFEEKLKAIQATIEKHLKISVSIIVSTAAASLEHVSYLYNQTVEGSIQRLFLGRQCIIYIDQMSRFSDNEYDYPQNKEKQLLEALMLGNQDEINRIYLEIVDYLSKFPYATMNMAFSYFVYKLNLSFETIIRNNFPGMPINLNTSISLTEYESIAEFNSCFFKAFEKLSELLAQKKNKKNDMLITRIAEIIASSYQDVNLSLEYIADKLDLNPNYLGRLYRSVSSKTIPEAIMDYRMNKARDLLTTTNQPIAQIAQNTGFTNDGYFYKAFRKANGITPSDFRKNFSVRKP